MRQPVCSPALPLRGLCALALAWTALAPSTARAARPDSAVTTVTDCTNAGLQAALNGGGLILFACPAMPASILISTTLEVTAASTTVDGGGQITLVGAGVRLLRQQTLGAAASTFTLRNLTLTLGRAVGPGAEANGGAIQSLNRSIGQDYLPTLIVEHVTFTDNDTHTTAFAGNAYDFGGGAIYSSGGVVHVAHSTFSGNDAHDGAGGAIHLLRSSLLVTASTFTQNSALGSAPANSQGGAIYVDGLWPERLAFSLVGSTFTDNTAFNSGGAVYLNLYEDASHALIVDSSFVDNAVVGGAGALGGAISGGGTAIGPGTGNPRVTITGSLFAANSAQRSASPYDGSGGALAFAQRAVLSITNATFSGNRAEGSAYNANGGALYVVNQTTPFVLNHVTFANNYAGWVGGAITGSPGVVNNSAFANNSAANGGNAWNIQQTCSHELIENGHNLQYPPRNTDPFTFNEVTCFAGKSAISQRGLPDFRDPQLRPLANNGGPTATHALSPTSPAFDGGEDAACALVDQRGIARPQAAHCDIGAFELVAQLFLDPPLVAAGSPGFILTVTGAGFTPASLILWEGDPLPTTVVSATLLNGAVEAGRVSAPATVAVSVSDSAYPAAALLIVADLARLFLPLVAR